MPDDKNQTKIGWLGQKAWQGTKAFGRMFGSDWLEKGDDTHGLNLHQISADQRYETTRSFSDAATAASHMAKLPGSIDCLKGVDSYLGDRAKALKEFYNKNDLAPIVQLDTQNATEATKSVNEFKALKADIDSRTLKGETVGAFCLRNELMDAKGRAQTNLNEQLKQDIATINALDVPAYDEEQKTEIISVLTKNNEDAFKKLEEAMNAEIKKQSLNAEAENSRLFFIKYYLAQATKEQIDQLEKSIHEEEKNSITMTLSAGPLVKPPKNLKDAQMSAIEEFKTLSGRTVTKNADGAYTISIPSRWNILYHKDSQDNTLADLKFLALAVHATGKKTLTFTLNGENEEDIKLIARKAYQAGFEAGFKGGTGVREAADDKETKEQKESREGNIRIVINGVLCPLLDEVKDGKVTKKGVFSSQQELEMMGRREKDFVHEREFIQARDKWPGHTISLTQQEVKDTLQENKNDFKASGGITNPTVSEKNVFTADGGATASAAAAVFTASGNGSGKSNHDELGTSNDESDTSLKLRL